jgi:hypothetical protein
MRRSKPCRTERKLLSRIEFDDLNGSFAGELGITPTIDPSPTPPMRHEERLGGSLSSEASDSIAFRAIVAGLHDASTSQVYSI